MTEQFQLARHQAEAYHSSTSLFMDGSARLLVRDASVGPGDVVLDLACGTGLVAGHAAELVTPGGRVVGADINPAMLAVARERTGTDIEWVEAPCDALPLADATCTHVICQQGFQFFPDPVAAAVEARRVLRPGGALIATIWATPGQNPYIENQLDLLATYDPSLTASVRRATPPHADDLLRDAAAAAGFDDVEVTILEHAVDVADLAPWFLAQTAGTPWGPALAKATDAERNELAASMAERMDPHLVEGVGHRIPFRSYRLHARNRP